MSRYIDADKFIGNLKTDHWGVTNMVEVGIAIDKSVADVVEVRHGEWQLVDSDIGYCELECSLCKSKLLFITDDGFTYCPKCGAKMDGERR